MKPMSEAVDLWDFLYLKCMNIENNVDKIINLYKKGFSVNEITNEVKVSETYIYKILNKYQLIKKDKTKADMEESKLKKFYENFSLITVSLLYINFAQLFPCKYDLKL